MTTSRFLSIALTTMILMSLALPLSAQQTQMVPAPGTYYSCSNIGCYYNPVVPLATWFVFNGQTPPQAFKMWMEVGWACADYAVVYYMQREFPNDPAVDQIRVARSGSVCVGNKFEEF